MSKELSKDIIVALDIGTDKVAVIVAECLPDNRFEVIGKGESKSEGIRKGSVVNIDLTVKSIQQALEEAELMASCTIREVTTGIGGSHINSFNSSGMVAVKDREVTQFDKDRVLETAKAVNIPSDHQILHVVTQNYILDRQEPLISEPIGMAGIRLEVMVHIVTGSQSATQNIIKCVRRCGLEVADPILQPLADSMICLTPDEKQSGVALIDIGCGTTDLAIFKDGAVRYTTIMPMAGDQITGDISFMLRIPRPDAEEVKLRYGVAKSSLISHDEVFEIEGLGDRASRIVSCNELSQIIESRVEEIFLHMYKHIQQSETEINGVVLTGGTALLPGILELAEDIFHTPIRLGVPLYEGNLSDVVRNPRYSTAMGLLVEARMNTYGGDRVQQNNSFLKRILGFIKSSF